MINRQACDFQESQQRIHIPPLKANLSKKRASIKKGTFIFYILRF